MGKASGQLSSIFDFTVESELAFTFPREGSGHAPLKVMEDDGVTRPEGPPLMEWWARPGHGRAARLYEAATQYLIWIDQGGWFRVDRRQASILVSPSTEPFRREASLWGLPSVLCFMERGDLPLHAAAIDVDGSAILLAAPGHSGKTTLACAFLQAGYRVLAEDLSCCRPLSTPQLLPGPAMLRVRRDTYEHLELAGTREVARDPDRVLLTLEPDLKGDGRAVPIRSIVLLGFSDGPLAIERVPLPRAIGALWSLVFMLPGDADRARSFQSIAAIASAVSVWTLRWHWSFGELPDVVNTVVSTCRS